MQLESLLMTLWRLRSGQLIKPPFLAPALLWEQLFFFFNDHDNTACVPIKYKLCLKKKKKAVAT